MKMLLEVEEKKPVQVVTFVSIEKSLRDLKSFGPHPFAVLSAPDGYYLQIAGGGVTCVLEHRKNGREHCRAFFAGHPLPDRLRWRGIENIGG